MPSTMSSLASAEQESHDLVGLEAGLGHRFGDPGLLRDATTHRSWCAENGGTSNERLEFLGDAVLGMVVADQLFRDHPGLSEGHLAMIRAAVVSAPALAEVARVIRLGDSIRFGHGELTSGGSDKESILADALEAVIAAVHLDGGPEAAGSLVRRLFGDRLVLAAVDPGIQDYKTRLQELAARESIPTPRYVLTDEGPDHDKRFHAVVEVAGGSHGPATGTSRKRAEQAAARLAWDAIGGTPPVTDRRPSTTADTPPTTSLEAT